MSTGNVSFCVPSNLSSRVRSTQQNRASGEGQGEVRNDGNSSWYVASATDSQGAAVSDNTHRSVVIQINSSQNTTIQMSSGAVEALNFLFPNATQFYLADILSKMMFCLSSDSGVEQRIKDDLAGRENNYFDLLNDLFRRVSTAELMTAAEAGRGDCLPAFFVDKKPSGSNLVAAWIDCFLSSLICQPKNKLEIERCNVLHACLLNRRYRIEYSDPRNLSSYRKLPRPIVDRYIKPLLSQFCGGFAQADIRAFKALRNILKLLPNLVNQAFFDRLCRLLTTESQSNFASGLNTQDDLAYKFIVLLVLLDMAYMLPGRNGGIEDIALLEVHDRTINLSDGKLDQRTGSLSIITALNTIFEKLGEDERILVGLSYVLNMSLESEAVLLGMSAIKDLSIVKAYRNQRQSLFQSPKYLEAKQKASQALSAPAFQALLLVGQKSGFAVIKSDLDSNRVSVDSLNVQKLIHVLLSVECTRGDSAIFDLCLSELIARVRSTTNISELRSVLKFVSDVGLLDHISLPTAESATTGRSQAQRFDVKNICLMGLVRALAVVAYTKRFFPLVIADINSNRQSESWERLLLLSAEEGMLS